MKLGIATILNESVADRLLLEATEGRDDIRAFALELQEAMAELIQTQQSLLLEQEELSADQLEQLFVSASRVSQGQSATQSKFSKGLEKLKAAGGKVAKAAKKVDDVINKAGKYLQQTEPVKNFDTKFDKLRSEFLEKNPKTAKAVEMLGQAAKNNPKTTAFTIAALSGVVGFAGLPGMGPVVGAALRAAVGAAKGEKASAIVGKAAKFGAIGGAAAMLGDLVGDAFSTESSGNEKLAKVESKLDTTGMEEDARQSLMQRFPTEDDFKQAMAEDIWAKSPAGKAATVVSGGGESMSYDQDAIARIKENIKLQGSLEEGNIRGQFKGTFVRGGHYLAPDQVSEFQQIVERNGGGMSGIFSDEAEQWLNKNAPMAEAGGGGGTAADPDELGSSEDAAPKKSGKIGGRLMPRNVPSHLKGTSTGF